MMYELVGASMKELSFELIKRGDIIYYEGPVLSHFVDEFGNDYLMRWTEMDETANRWMLMQVSQELIVKHLSGKISLLTVIRRTKSGTVFFIDMVGRAEHKHIKCVEIGAIPDVYMPDKDSHFEMKYGTSYAQHLLSELIQTAKKQNDLHSFWSKATNTLYGKEANDIRVLFTRRHSSSARRHEGHLLRDTLLHQVLDFPLLLHYHARKFDNIDFAVINKAGGHGFIIADASRVYLDTAFLGNLNTKDIVIFVSNIIASTHSIVEQHPTEYGALYEKWKTTIKKEWSEVTSIEKELENIF